MKEPAGHPKAEPNEIRQLMLKEIEKDLRGSCLFVTQYQGLSVKDLEELRKKLYPVSSRYLVAKNNLSRIALKSLGFEELIPTVSGQTGFVVGESDPLAISKILAGYVKNHEALKLCGGLVEGEILSAERLLEFVKLPSREALIGKTVLLIKSPLTGLEAVLSGTIRKLLYALQEISKKSEGGGTT